MGIPRWKGGAGGGFKVRAGTELLEELGIAAVIGHRLERYDYAYPGSSPIQLVFYRVSEFQGEPANLIFEQIRWEKTAKLPEYDFLEGDVDFVKRLAKQGS